MNNTVVYDGEMGIITKVTEGDLPYYTGATEVTPSDQTQTLYTAETIVTSNITVNPIPDMELETVDVTYTPTESEQTDTITASSGYDAIEQVNVTVEAIDSEYVGSDVPRNDSTDLTASGATITAPAGYYAENASASVASGTEGTPTATKGTVSSHSVSVTPSVTNAAGYISGGTHTGTAVTVSASELVSGNKAITANGTDIDVTEYATVSVAVPGDTPTLQTKSVSYTPTESAQSATVTADQGYDGLDEVNISVGAISSSYVGSAIDRRDSADLSASGATVTAPAGYYESAATKSVASGTAGTPSATKGAVSNHSVSVTPSVTNTAGYISGGTISGTAVTVDVTELESGTKSITENGTGISVSGYSAVDVNVSGGGGISVDEMAAHTGPSGDITITTATVQERAFMSTPITGVTLTTRTSIPSMCFNGCSSLVYVASSSVTGMSGNQNFLGCTSLTTINLPNITALAGNAFQGCTSLQVFDLPKLTSLNYARCLYGCSNLKTIVLRSTSVVPINNDCLTNTPFGSGGSGGTIYIPESLYNALGTGTNDYKATANWSTYDGYGTITWAKIEDSYYETHYADGTTIPT